MPRSAGPDGVMARPSSGRAPLPGGRITRRLTRLPDRSCNGCCETSRSGCTRRSALACSSMDAEDVLEVLRLFEELRCRVWIAGGWAVDAAFGLATREHGDLDLAFPAEAERRVLAGLHRLGFRIVVDWRPARVALRDADGREVDLHPLTFNDDGSAEQAGLDETVFDYPADCFTTGLIEGQVVPCLSVAQQLRFRQGYKHRPKDNHDVALLNAIQGSKAQGGVW